MKRGQEHQLLIEWNDTGASFAPGALVHGLWKAQARRSPAAVAVAAAGAGGEAASYRELDRRSDRLAAVLRGLGVGTESIVAVFLPRSIDVVVAWLAILKAGGAYLSLETTVASARLAFVLEDAAPRLIVTRERLRDRLPEGAAPVLSIDADGGRREGRAAPAAAVDPESAAYVLYTSGSAGRPKAAVISRRALSNHMLWMQSALPLAAADRVLHKTPLSFDATVWELWAPLLAGARLVLSPPGAQRDPERLVELLRAERITVLQVVPSLLGLLLEEPGLASCRDLRRLLCGGELLASGLAERFLQSGLRAELLNGYGPTEATIHTSVARLPPGRTVGRGRSVAIGRPIANLRAYVLDRALRPVPPGTAGDLFVAGAGLARGYLGRRRLSAERFLPDPFAGVPGSRLYDTGDRVRHLPDGALEFLGRRDRQVKIRGVRVELEEIEAVLREQPAVRQAAVELRPRPAGAGERLVAYLVPQTDGGETWREELLSRWRSVYDSVYTEEEASQLAGWNSSYTGEAMPAEEVRDMVDQAVERILDLGRGRVLEIGCGTGLLLFPIAPHCDRYLGTDLSPAAVDAVVSRLSDELPQVAVRAQAAHDFAGIEPGSFDVVFLNSVVGHFPGVDYLLEVVDGMVEAAAPGGAVFLGDVRSLPLLDAFHASVELARAAPDLPLAELGERIASRGRREEGMAVEPSFFAALKRRHPRIRDVRILPKAGRFSNELTRFRYDVVLDLDGDGGSPPGGSPPGGSPPGGSPPGGSPPGAEAPAVTWLDWRRQGLTLDDVRRHLERRNGPALGLSQVTNRRLAREVELLARLREEPRQSLRDFDAAFSPAPGAAPEDFAALIEDLPYACELSWSRCAPEGRYDVLFWRAEDGGGRPRLPEPATASLRRPWNAYANDPRRSQLAGELVPRLRQALRERLPAEMVPSAFVLLEALPALPSGKVDRRALPDPGAARPRLDAAFEAPRTRVEKELAALWREVLGIGRIGLHDSFFELGGHSLLATQVMSRLRDSFQVELPVRSLFEGPTVAELAAAVGEARPGAVRGTEAPPIRAQPRGGELPLSFAQERLWFQYQLAPESPEYVVPEAYRLQGPLDVTALEEALRAIASRHEIFRTTYRNVDGRPRQVLSASLTLCLPVVDLRGLAEEAREAEALRLAAADAWRPFDLERGPLLRVTLVRLAASRHLFLSAVHHLLTDGWSDGVYHRETGALYDAFVRRQAPSLPEPRIQYADFAVWQRQWLRGTTLDGQLAYWRRRLAGLPVLALSTDRPRPAVASYRGAIRPFAVPRRTAEPLRRLGRERGVSLFMVLLAGFVSLLERWTLQDDVVVGSPIAQRNRRETEALMGFFINMLVMRVDLSGAPSFRRLLERVREVALGAYAHQDLPFEKLVEDLGPARDPGRHPLFQIAFSFQNFPDFPLELRGLSAEAIRLEAQPVRFDLELFVREEDDGTLGGLVIYSTDLFDATTITRLVGHLQRLLARLAADPELRPAQVPPLAPAERHQLAVEWNDSRASSASSAALPLLFEAQAERTPEAAAVEYGWTLSYRELNEAANRLAHRLRSLGVGDEARVAVLAERSPEMVIGLLAVLKAGGAYVPLDVSYPRRRLRLMLRDAGVSVLLAQPPLLGRLGEPPGGLRLAGLGPRDPALSSFSAANPRLALHPLSLAYVMYTSGSTGRPKGVAVPHRGVVRLVREASYVRVRPGERVAQLSATSFDAATFEIWGALLSGACLVGLEREVTLSPAALAAELRRREIDVAFLTTALFHQVIGSRPDAFATLRCLLFGGEVVDPEQVRLALRHGAPRRLLHVYGPTENTTFSTWQRVNEVPRGTRALAIGRPISNSEAWVLDAALGGVPIGVAGELWTGGDGLARGYFGRPRLTAERFVPHPYAAVPGRRLYRTGDLARYRADGRLDFLGRRDGQVKIRGFRVEPGEIESVLSRLASVEQAVVKAGESLVAYVVAVERGAAPEEQIPLWRAHLAERLPPYMVPAAFVTLARLPLLPNGKVDRAALPDPDGSRPLPEATFTAPRSAAEERLTRIWAAVLGVERVGVHDNFFELGGHSLLVIQVVAKVRRELGVELGVRSLFESPTVADLARRLVAAPRCREDPPVLSERVLKGRI